MSILLRYLLRSISFVQYTQNNQPKMSLLRDVQRTSTKLNSQCMQMAASFVSVENYNGDIIYQREGDKLRIFELVKELLSFLLIERGTNKNIAIHFDHTNGVIRGVAGSNDTRIIKIRKSGTPK